MTSRTTTQTVTFRKAFSLKGVGRVLPPGDYRVDVDEHMVDGISFLAWRRTATSIFLPAQSSGVLWREMIPLDPQDLDAARAQDAEASETPSGIEHGGDTR